MPKPTLETIVEVLEEVVDLTGVEARASSRLGQDIPIDSREMLRVVSRIESRFAIRFAPSDLLQMETLGDLLAAARRRAAGR